VIKGLLTRKEQWILIFLAGSIVVGSAVLWWERRDTTGISVIHDVESTTPPDASGGSGDGVVTNTATDNAATIRVIRAPVETGSGVDMGTGHITVSVAGAVNQPDVYKLPAGSIVEDAVEAAGGYAASADPGGINRAAKLIDGTTLTVPTERSVYVEGDSRPALRIVSPATNIPAYLPGSVPHSAQQQVVSGAAPAVRSGKININTASREELETLPRIGPKLADTIVEYRSKHPFRSIEEIQNVPRIGPKTFDGLKELITVGEG
jgi:competence protein ComEA